MRALTVSCTAIFLTSNVLGSIFQIASLPVVILAPLGAVSLLWNAFFARLILGDVFSRYMLLGTLFVVVGAILIGIYGIVPEPTHSLDDLLRLFGRTSFVVYFSLLALAVILISAIVSMHFSMIRRISICSLHYTA
jgi:drug/metabolite transporter (DMT)-like permease